MKSYVLRTGSRFTFVVEKANNNVIGVAVADRDISFDAKELVEVDTVTGILHFHVGNSHYYANNSAVSVYH